jgi:sensor domain CHASE-containing protein
MQNNTQKLYRYIILPTIVVVIIMVLLNYLLYVQDTNIAKAEEQAALENAVENIESELQQNISEAASIKAFYLGTEAVTEKEFNTFTRSLTEGSTIQGTSLEWTDAQNYVRYIYPLTATNQKALNFNNNLYPNRMTPIALAKATREPAVSEPLILAQGYPGILVYLPIFKNEEYIGSASRRIRLSSVINEAALTKWKDGDIRLITENFIYDIKNDQIFNSEGFLVTDAKEKLSDAPELNSNQNMNLLSSQIKVVDKNWSISVVAKYDSQLSSRIGIYLMIDLLVIVLIEIFLFTNLKYQNKLNSLIESESSLRQQLEKEMSTRYAYEGLLKDQNKALLETRNDVKEEIDNIKAKKEEIAQREMEIQDLQEDIEKILAKDKGEIPKPTAEKVNSKFK